MWVRVVSLLLGVAILASCSFGRPTTIKVTQTPSDVSITATQVPPTQVPTATPIPLPTSTTIPIDTTIRIRVIAADTDSYQPLVAIIERAALDIDLDVVVDIRSPDGALALHQGVITGDVVDLWLANSFDLWQLAQIGAVSAAPITSDVPLYPFATQGMAVAPVQGIAPLAAQNYLIGIYNTEILSSAPTTTTQLQAMPGLLIRPRYRMAYAWAEGRWFDEIMQQMTATTVITDGVQTIDRDATITAVQTLVDLRSLGPRGATSYIESITDFLYSRVPYTLDGDAALRRYGVLSETLLLDYALPPLITASDTLWLPDVDVVYAAVPAEITPTRRTQVLALIQQLQKREVQGALFREMRWIPVRNDVLPTLTDDRLAIVLNQVGQLVDAQRYDEAIICRWDSYEQVLPFALLKVWRIDAVVTALESALATCPVVEDAP